MNCTYKLRAANPTYQGFVNRITDRYGMPRIEVYEADTANACATLMKDSNSGRGKLVITYNPDFIESLRQQNPWAVVTVFAHEVAHHFNQDISGRFLYSFRVNKISHRKELNADRFAGWVLKCEGASLHEAQALYKSIQQNQSYTHPGRIKRIQAMEQGWYEAICTTTPPKRVIKSAGVSLGEALVTMGCIAILGYSIASILEG